MAEIKTGGSAFPGVAIINPSEPVENLTVESGGMTLRQWYAGMAMQGMLARGVSMPHDILVSSALAVADAMIAEESKT